MRWIFLFGALLLSVWICLAAFEKSVFDGGQVLLQEKWGQVTLIDVYLGFLLVIGMIWKVEARPLVALLWSVAVIVLGNVVSVVFILLNWQALLNAFASIREAKASARK